MGARRVRVLVTGLGGGGHGQQIVKALRLGELNYHIVGADITGRSVGRAVSDEFVVLPPAGSPDYMDSLARTIREHRVEALFHGCEREMMLFSGHRDAIEALGVYVPVNPPPVMAVCQNKTRTGELLRRHGTGQPRYVVIRRPGDAEAVNFLPAVLKPSVGGGGSAHVHIAQTRRELALLVEYLLDLCPEIMAQEYVGTADAEFTVGVLFGRDGALLNSIAVRRLVQGAMSTRLRVPNRTGRQDLGDQLVISSGISQGEVGRWPEVTRPCEALASELGAQAPINVQCRLVDGEVKIFEINPRFSGTTSLRAMVGYNEPDVLVRRDMLGQAVTPGFDYREGTVLRSLHETLLDETAIPQR